MSPAPPLPYTLIAELTYRCPLRCAYCSNPTVPPDRPEMPLAAWLRVLDEAEALGILQVHFTGGEPLLFDGLETLVERARQLGIHGGLVTSGVPFAPGRFERLRAAGLDHVQISFQWPEAGGGRDVAGVDAFDEKVAACGAARSAGLPLTVNVVLHRANIDRIDGFVALAERLGAEHLELANVQWLGWALENRGELLPTRAQIEAARSAVSDARARLGKRMRISFVMPDYFAGRPRACMDGWARRYVLVAPDGLVLPCHAARRLPLSFASATETSLFDAWTHADGMRRFRDTDALAEPCRSCDARDVDFGGCRCQAFELTGDAAQADPACSKSPHHVLVREAIDGTGGHVEGGFAPKLRRLPMAPTKPPGIVAG